MRWSASMISRLVRVRDVRLRMAEMALAAADRELAACRAAESQARQDLADAALRCANETAQADQALLQRACGGRIGISHWQDARKRARFAVQTQRSKLEDAVSSRLGKELALSTARRQWRETRSKVERMQLLVDQMEDSTP